MKYGCSFSIEVMLIAALMIPARLPAQDKEKPNHHRYKLIEIGTFGGPNSYFAFITQPLNASGAAAGFADTADAINPPFCLVDCFASRAFMWKGGVVTDLGFLPGEIGFTGPNGINARGVVAGSSFNGGFDPALGLPYFDAVVFKDRQVIDLGTFGGPLSYSAAINDRDQATGQLTPLTVTFEVASMSHLPANVVSAGDTITLSLRGSAIGRLPGFTSRAKNWLKVSHPLGPTK